MLTSKEIHNSVCLPYFALHCVPYRCTFFADESDNSPTGPTGAAVSGGSNDPSPRSNTARRSPLPSTSSREIGNENGDNGDNGNGDDGNADSELDNNNEVLFASLILSLSASSRIGNEFRSAFLLLSCLMIFLILFTDGGVWQWQ